MKTKIIKEKHTNWAIPGDPISVDEFKAGIKAAEKGPFMTLEEMKKSVDKLKKSQSL